MLRSLYVCYLSLDDPLVESQVVAYLEGLGRRGHTIHLLTFETRSRPRADRTRMREAMQARGVSWHGLPYHKRPSLPATAFDTLRGALACAWLVRRHRLDAVHARSHVPAAMAILAAPFAPHSLIFDLRGLMAEEYVDLGRWRHGGLAFRIAKHAERAAIRRAARVVVLTERVKSALFGEDARDDVCVIPCCADVERIAPQRRHREDARVALGLTERPALAYVGKLGGWYLDDEMADFFVVARDVIPGLQFVVATQSDPDAIVRQFARRGIAPSEYVITSVEHARLGELLAAADAAVALIKQVPSKVASSPTKIGECLAAGLPVVATDIGDVRDVLERTRAGIVLEDFSGGAYRKAAGELSGMLADAGTAARCIATARERLSLREVGVPRYDALYQSVAHDVHCVPVPRPCPSCGARPPRALSRFRQIGMVRCSACGLAYTGRAPDDHELAAWYAEYPIEDRLPPATVARLDEVIRSLAPYRRLGTLLDVGAGSGHLLAAAARAGWAPHAVEPGPRQRERLTAQGFTLHPPLPEASDIADCSFDVVVMQEVIEHMREPGAVLREVRRVLRPGGLLYITCPNFGSLSSRVLGPRWRVVEYPEHLNYFTPSALRRLTGRFGFRELAVTTTGMSLDNAGAAVDERVREVAMRYRAADALRRGTNVFLSSLELGDTIKGRYERDSSSRS
jgi:SAM-dependent methyltransferase/glycosyltransferase involved in cell wall biosynthesis